MIASTLNYINREVPVLGLSIYRLILGCILIWEVIYFYRIDFIQNFIFGPSFLFNYDFLPLKPLSRTTMEWLIHGMLLASILIAIGRFTKWALAFMGISMAYLLLLDKGIYNNHLYLISLICFLLCFTDSERALSLGRMNKAASVPIWQYFLIQGQLAIVFVFGGIAKINPYWLNFHPVRELLEIRASESGLDFIRSMVVEYIIMLGGIGFDILIPFLLWYRKTRTVAIILALFFNISNAWIFKDINIFPFFMISSLILFVNQENLYRLIYKSEFKLKVNKNQSKLTKYGLYLFSLYFLVQMILPIRHFTFPGYVDWTGEGQYFAWRMKIQNRKIHEMKFALFDIDKREVHEINPVNFLNLSQYQQMSLHPKMMVQFAEFLKKEAMEKMQIRNCMVKSKVNVTFNGSDPVYVFNPNLDLLEEYKKNESFNDWINPLPKAKNY